MDPITSARKTLTLEAAAIERLIERVDERFTRATQLILDCQGRVVVSGMGKSGAIARKLAATLASTGTPALFMHPAEGGHGDLGMVVRGDVVVILSGSGETEELKQLLPALRRLATPIISLCGVAGSTLERESDVSLDISITEEACPMGLAPTTSTTAALALADALAIAVLEKRNFTRDDFAVLHPGGSIGRRLLVRVGDLMHAGDALPLVQQSAGFENVLCAMTSRRLGCTGVTDETGALIGIVTDGDLRRHLEKTPGDLRELTAMQMMTPDPKTIVEQSLAATALALMSEMKITSLFVVAEGKPVGLLHIHDILRAGIR